MNATYERPLKYAATTRLLHWLVALMVLAMIPIGIYMQTEGLPRAQQNLLFVMHKNGGVILLALVLLRLVWRATHRAPSLPASLPRWQVRAAGLTQAALYILLLVMALSGYVRVAAGGFPIEMLDAIGMPSLVPRSDSLAGVAKTIHSYARFGLIALVALHVAAGLKHLVQRDGVFSRIWPPVGGR
ncbi:cytochrome b [Roseicitreum antarcticum]|uniref:Cytochrome b561 n=1 Tax=Roseicitreum antarcticum TaxID=564137 RepID=A0A1H2ZCI7_9RHOB|nr:cytochrome b/b6 domain-containing protein [Roseicitreum antarcticum]SDX15213.1 cytochrome b561 [Roseicitreum antarcticum]